ncbi:MAG TPA: tRNA (adenosine(37)-N6)-threonylcarbamoyltransferase complex dimerization subunit type 1 TsaB [Acidobacteriaceae bacterium]|jgi:tRNA threonylcarbamoyladenosine biosynthesis protein TsaB|nr:tRNA (adenosine(37)-N6)-threonylcarbamoyltransferase complex dimerization subunit type 1 TsaB [Acidobacteriaceae bacterium]
MRILLIDTCGEAGSVALADTAAAVPKVVSAVLPGRSASERLAATVRELATAAEMQLTTIGAIAVVNGPGSFTGVRVGVSAAKGLCEALGIPVVAISRLEVLAGVAGGYVAALLDAGRGEFYCGVYNGESCLREALLTKAELIDLIADGGRVVVCEPHVAQALAEMSPLVVPAPSAEAALPIAIRRVAAKQFEDVETLDANYLRRTDAEIFAKQHSTGASR